MTAFSEQVIKYDTELIERWGCDIDKIQPLCLDAGLPEPTFEEYQGFYVVFVSASNLRVTDSILKSKACLGT